MEKEIKKLEKEIIKGNIFVISLFAILIPILPIQAILVLDHCLSISVFVIKLSLLVAVILYCNSILFFRKATLAYLYLEDIKKKSDELAELSQGVNNAIY